MHRYFGLLGPAVFFFVAFFLAALLPGYSSQSQMISELGASGAVYSDFFNYLAFLPNGILITAFGIYFHQQLRLHSINPIAAVFIMVHGVGMILATWMSCDISCNPSEPSIQQIGHSVIAAIKFAALHLSIIIFALQLLKLGISKPFAYCSIVTFMVSAVLMFLFATSVESRELTGVYQRLFIGTVYAWLAFVSLNLHKILPR
jgi:hypothetical protein